MTGAVSLVPFDGTASAAGRLYPVRRIQESLARLSLQRAILMFDVSLESSPGMAPTASASPVWDAGASDESFRTMWMIGNKDSGGSRYERARHGLFTYQLLRGCKGRPISTAMGRWLPANSVPMLAEKSDARHASNSATNRSPCAFPLSSRGDVRMQPMAKGNNPKPAPPVKKDGPGSGGSPNMPAFGVFPKP